MSKTRRCNLKRQVSKQTLFAPPELIRDLTRSTPWQRTVYLQLPSFQIAICAFMNEKCVITMNFAGSLTSSVGMTSRRMPPIARNTAAVAVMIWHCCWLPMDAVDATSRGEMIATTFVGKS